MVLEAKLNVYLSLENPERWKKLNVLYQSLLNIKDTRQLVSILEELYQVSGNRIEELKESLKDTNQQEKQTGKWPFSGLQKFLDDIASVEERESFFHSGLRFIASLAAKLKEFSPNDGLFSIPRQKEASVALNRKFIASLLASGFLCSLPPSLEETGARTLNFDNFFACFHRMEYQATQAAKLRCILHYFERLAASQLDLQGEVTFTRQLVGESVLPSLEGWAKCDAKLCPVVVDHQGRIELDLDGSLIQEEIRFCLSPELMVSTLLMGAMEDNEVIVIKGAERFSSYNGYGKNFQFAGDFQDSTKRDVYGNLQTMVVAMDTTSFKHQSRDNQYEEGLVLREVNEALVRFYNPEVGCEILNESTRNGTKAVVDVVDIEDAGILYLADNVPQENERRTIQELCELGETLVGRAFKEAWGEIEMSCARDTDSIDSSDILTTLMKKSVEEVFKKTPEKARLYSETVISASLVPKCLQHQFPLRESTSPLVPGTPPSSPVARSQGASGSQTPISPPSTPTVIAGVALGTISFADSLSKSLLSCVSLTSSLATSIATVASAPLQITSVTKEAFQKSPKDLGSPVKNGDKLISYLSQKVYDVDASETIHLAAKKMNYSNISEFAEDLTSLVRVQKSDWSNREAVKSLYYATNTSPEFECVDLSDQFNSEEESEARRRSLAELALSLFQDFASTLANSVIESAIMSFDGESRLARIAEESEGTDSDDECSDSCHDGNCGNERDSRIGEGEHEDKRDRRHSSSHDSESDGSHDSESDGSHDSESDGSHDSESDGSHDSESDGSHDSESDSSHDSESDSDLHCDWNSSDIENEIEDKFFQLDLSDEEVSHIDNPDKPKCVPEMITRIVRDIMAHGISEAAVQLKKETKPEMTEKEIVNQQDKQVELDNPVDSYTLSYEDPKCVCDGGFPEKVSLHAKRFSSSILNEALLEATKQIIKSKNKEDSSLDLSNTEKREDYLGDLYVNNAVGLKEDCLDLENVLGNVEQELSQATEVQESSDIGTPIEITSETCERNSTESTSDATTTDSLPATVSPVLMAALQEFADTLSQQLIEASTALADASIKLQSGAPMTHPVATGNWGCGVFWGDPELKAILQWVAASAAGCPALVFYTFGDKRMSQFSKVQQTLRKRDWRVCDIMQGVSRYCRSVMEKKAKEDGVTYESVTQPSLFQFLLETSQSSSL